MREGMEFGADISGRQFGRLTALRVSGYKEVGTRKQRVTQWLCVCSCGKEKSIARGSLLNGLTKSCGCLVRDVHSARRAERAPKCEAIPEPKVRLPRIDLSGKKFGRLNIVRFAGWRNNYSMWHCKCECGTKKIVRGSNITNGAIVSCGCFARERTREVTLKDLTGLQFGYATVISQVGKKGNDTLWNCKCECGNTFSAFGFYLKGKRYPASCGCHATAMKREVGKQRAKHGFATNFERPVEYMAWGMARVRHKKRGQPIAPEFDDFETFLAEVGSKPSGTHRLVVLNRSKGFAPGNVEWRDFPRANTAAALVPTEQAEPVKRPALPWAR